MILADLERRASMEEREKWEQKRVNALFFMQNRKSTEELQKFSQRKKLIHANLWQPTDEFKVPYVDAQNFRAEEEQDKIEAAIQQAKLKAQRQALPTPEYHELPQDDAQWNQDVTSKFNSDHERGLLQMDEPPAELLIGARPSVSPSTGRQGKAPRHDSSGHNGPRRKAQHRPKQAEAHAAVEAAGSVGFLASVDRSKLHKLPEVVKFFHPTRWTAQEVALVREMLLVYGKDWTLVAGLLGKSKTAQVLKNTYKSCHGNWETVPTLSVLQTTCTVCSGPFSKSPMVFCSCCDKGYHTSCTDPPLALIPTDCDWFCSSECASSCRNRCEGCGGDRSIVISSHSTLASKSSPSSSAATPNSSAAAADVADHAHLMEIDSGAGGEVPVASTEEQREMIECDHCGKNWHSVCVTPKLESIPEGDWLCPRCSPNSASIHHAESEGSTSPRKPSCDHPGGVSPLTSSADAASYKNIPMTSSFAVQHRPLDDITLRTIVASLQPLPWSYLLALSRVCLDCHFARFAGGSMVPRDVTIVPSLLSALDDAIQVGTASETLQVFMRGSIFKYAKREDITVTVPTLNNELMQVHFGRLLNTVENAIDRMLCAPVFQLDKTLEMQLERAHKKQVRDSIQATTTPLESVGRRAASALGAGASPRIPHTGLRATDSRRTRKRTRSLGGSGPAGSFDTIMVPSPDGSGQMVPAPAPRFASSSQTPYEDFNREDGYGESDQRYWIFQANPQLYDINSSVKMLPDMTWFVKQHINRIRKGDRVFIWESGKNAGVLGTGTVKSDPVHILEVPGMLQFTYVKQLFDTVQLRCHLHIDCVLPLKVLKSEFQSHPILCQLTILRAPIGTNFRITKSQGLSLDQLVRDRMALGGGTVHPDANRLPNQMDMSNFMANPTTIVTEPSAGHSSPTVPIHHGTARTRAAAAAAQQRAAAAAANDSSAPPAPKRRRVNPSAHNVSASPASSAVDSAVPEFNESGHVHTSARTQEYGKQRNVLDSLVHYKSEDNSPFLPAESVSSALSHGHVAPSELHLVVPSATVEEFEVEDVEDESADEGSPKPKRQKISPRRGRKKSDPVAALPPAPESHVAGPPSPVRGNHISAALSASPTSLLASPAGGSGLNLTTIGLGSASPFSLESPDDAIPDFDVHHHQHLGSHLDDEHLGVNALELSLIHGRHHHDMVDSMLADDIHLNLDSHLLGTDFPDPHGHSASSALADTPKPKRRKRADNFLGPMAVDDVQPRPHNTRVRGGTLRAADGSSDLMDVDSSVNEVLLVQPVLARSVPTASHDNLFPPSSYDASGELEPMEDSNFQSHTPLSTSTSTTAIGSPAPAASVLGDPTLDLSACASCGTRRTDGSSLIISPSRHALCQHCTMTFGMVENLILTAGLRELWCEVERLVQIKTDYAIRQHRKNIAEVCDPQEMFSRFDIVVRELTEGKSVMILAASTSFNNFRERVLKKIKRDVAGVAAHVPGQ